MKSVIIVFCLLLSFDGITQSVSTNFLIVNSTRNYNSALKSAQSAANKLGIPMNLRNCYKDNENGLTSSEVCGCGEKHGYIPRGRYDNGEYISIEYSSSFENFTQGFYIVVISSGEAKEVEKLLPMAKKYSKDAYAKKSDVYMGCMH